MPRKLLAIDGGEPVRKVPFPAWPEFHKDDLERISSVLESSQWGGNNPVVEEFESLFAQCHDASYGIAVSSGSMALEVALHAADIQPGDEVIVPAHSFIATASAVSRVGATPVFVDIELGSYNIDPLRVLEAVNETTKAIIVVHFGGVMASMDRFDEIARKHDLLVIEDAAHAHGAESLGRRAGSLGHFGAFSFQNSKAMNSGEGGILITNDNGLAAKARSIANVGRHPDCGWFDHFELGTNLRMTGIQATVLKGQLDRLLDQIRLRNANAIRFVQEISQVEGFSLQQSPEKDAVQTHYILPGRIRKHSFGMDRDRFVEAVQAEGIPVRKFYPHPLYCNPLFQDHAHRVLDCPIAEQACQDSWWLPLNVFMGTAEDAADVARAIAKVHAAVKPDRTKMDSTS